MNVRSFLPLLLLSAAGCASLRTTRPTTSNAALSVASQYWFRGTPRSTKPVAQGSAALSVPLREGTFDFTTWGNINLGTDTGDGAFRDGNGGEFSQIDLIASHGRSIGPYDVTGGVISYNYPNLVGRSTHEAYVAVSSDAWNLSHKVGFYYDFDSAKDFYLSYEILRCVGLESGWELDLSALLGLMSKDQAELYFGQDDAGFSDLSATAKLSRSLDEVSSIFFSLSAITVPDSSLNEALDDAGLDDTGLWFTVGAAWSL